MKAARLHTHLPGRESRSPLLAHPELARLGSAANWRWASGYSPASALWAWVPGPVINFFFFSSLEAFSLLPCRSASHRLLCFPLWPSVTKAFYIYVLALSRSHKLAASLGKEGDLPKRSRVPFLGRSFCGFTPELRRGKRATCHHGPGSLVISRLRSMRQL